MTVEKLCKILSCQFLKRRQCPLDLCGSNAVSDPNKSRCAEIVAWYQKKFVLFRFLTECIRVRFRSFHEEIESAVRVNAGEAGGG